MPVAPATLPHPQRRRLALGIHLKLIGLIAVLISAIVVFLTLYLPYQQIERIRVALSTRAAGYGVLLSRQVRSAVAFADRETAREVLSSLESDVDLASLVLYGDEGQTLYQHGAASPWVDRAREGVVSARLFATSERISVVAPVESLEGPAGTLVIELSTARMHAGMRRVITTAIVAGLAALVFGIAAAWFIARSLARRLGAIAQVAASVAAGDTAVAPVDDPSSDEIGALAGAFNRMVEQLQSDKHQLRGAITELTEAEDALARVNSELEDRVEARTVELTAANRMLVVEMEQRSRMELELRQAQKLESVGRLASGIAHEINTPIQFVSDSCHFLRDATGDVRRVIDEYRAALLEVGGGIGAPDRLARADKIDADADLPYLLENMPLAVNRSIEGLARVAAIVRAMKEFAYPERKERAPADLNQGIQTTLMVASNEYKYVADVTTELGDLPRVLCHVGEFNQVILNIVVNAAHSMQEQVDLTAVKGEIAIRTWTDGPDAMISIRDSGKGIPRDILDKIFDPFFTTKEVGKGTGQGLAIARSVVVDKHGGRLTVESEIGRGSMFTIALPIEGVASAAAPLALSA
ncbi:MAG TPA: ATP-binding protein [Kofleriaceae bacterium]|nr:ATP-binding protein [Kofleriaceae bacterium]